MAGGRPGGAGPAAASARLIAAQAALAAGDAFGAVAHAEAGLRAEPYGEAALRILMSAHQAAGRPALALRAYAEVAERLRDELGVDAWRTLAWQRAETLAAKAGPHADLLRATAARLTARPS